MSASTQPAAAVHSGPVADERFRTWITALARQRDMLIDRWGTAPLDPSGPPVRFAVLCNWHQGKATLEIEDSIGTRHEVPFDFDGRSSLGCGDPSNRLEWKPLGEPYYDIVHGFHGGGTDLYVALRDGRPAIVAMEYEQDDRGEPVIGQDSSHKLRADWDQRLLHKEWRTFTTEGDTTLEAGSADGDIIVASSERDVRAREPPARTWTLAGAKAGAPLPKLVITAATSPLAPRSGTPVFDETRANVSATLVVHLGADLGLPTHTDAKGDALLDAGEIELWYAASSDICGAGVSSCLRGVAITPSASGWVTSWLSDHEPGESLPTVSGGILARGGADAVTIDLDGTDAARCDDLRPPRCIPVTVAYASTPGSPAVATSQLDVHDVRSLGAVIDLGGGSYPDPSE